MQTDIKKFLFTGLRCELFTGEGLMIEILIGSIFFGVGFILFIFLVPYLPEMLSGLKDFIFTVTAQLSIAAAIGIGVIAGIALIIILVCKLLIFADDSCHEDKRYDEYQESITNILSKFN